MRAQKKVTAVQTMQLRALRTVDLPVRHVFGSDFVVELSREKIHGALQPRVIGFEGIAIAERKVRSKRGQYKLNELFAG